MIQKISIEVVECTGEIILLYSITIHTQTHTHTHIYIYISSIPHNKMMRRGMYLYVHILTEKKEMWNKVYSLTDLEITALTTIQL